MGRIVRTFERLKAQCERICIIFMRWRLRLMLHYLYLCIESNSRRGNVCAIFSAKVLIKGMIVRSVGAARHG